MIAGVGVGAASDGLTSMIAGPDRATTTMEPWRLPEHVVPGVGGGLDTGSVVALFFVGVAVAYLMVPWLIPRLAGRAGAVTAILPKAPAGRVLLASGLAAVAFQVIHFAEHGLQFGYLLLHPNDGAWLTPWAVATRDALGSGVVQGRGAASTPDEVLHFVGNALFFGGLIALAGLARTSMPAGTERRWLRIAPWVQGVHLAEHTLLTLTALVLDDAIGISNGFGVIAAGPGGATWYRVTLHMTVNLMASIAAVLALLEVARAARPSEATTLRVGHALEAAVLPPRT